MSHQTTGPNNEIAAKKRRKKASRACSHCQKAHLTCDDARPCQRCVKRGLETTCTDGIRKKAKYLQEDEHDPHFQANIASAPIINFNNNNNNTNNMNKNESFGSDTAASLEYGMISSMIPIVENPNYSQGTNFNLNNNNTNNLNWLDQKNPFASIQPTMMDANTLVLDNINSNHSSPNVPNCLTPRPIPAPLDFDRPKITKRRKGVGNTPREIYALIKQPYNYAESYHSLIEFVKSRMGKEELLRISRAIVLFRPSYMSVVASLTEEDLVYMEKCVQRMLLEFEKLISFSGTPTVVWRRTGEIVLVGKEFLLLTQWSKEALLGKKKFIYELMDNGSAIEYWEKFSQHAFDHAESGIYMSVILLSPTSRPVPCTFCFTLKRDIFDLPSVVVGNFLPILGATTV